MDKEKEIKELKNILLENKHHFREEDLNKRYTKEAIILISLGYGNVAQAVKEFAENKVKPLIDELVELLFNDNESTCRVEDCEKSDDIPCGCSICIEENKQVWKKKLDNLITKLYGAEN